MDDKEAVGREKHSGPASQEDGKVELRSFLVDFVRSTPWRAWVLARDAEEALQKFKRREVEEYDEEELDSCVEVTGVMEADG